MKHAGRLLYGGQIEGGEGVNNITWSVIFFSGRCLPINKLHVSIAFVHSFGRGLYSRPGSYNNTCFIHSAHTICFNTRDVVSNIIIIVIICKRLFSRVLIWRTRWRYITNRRPVKPTSVFTQGSVGAYIIICV